MRLSHGNSEQPSTIYRYLGMNPVNLTQLYSRISMVGGAKFWFHGLRNCFITVAKRADAAPSLTKQMVNHTRPNDVTEGYVADWTVAQLREPAEKIADRIEALMRGPEAP